MEEKNPMYELELKNLGLYVIWSEEDEIWKVFKFGGGLVCTTLKLETLGIN